MTSPRRIVTSLLVLVAICGCRPAGEGSIRDDRLKMGTRFSIQVGVQDRGGAREAIDAAYAEIDRVEALLSEWREESEISALNRGAGAGPRVVGPELFEVLERSVTISEWTEGAFDVTFAACGALWSFKEPTIPPREEIDTCLQRVGYQLLGLAAEDRSVDLPEGMQVGIAGIGKGYGVDRAAEVLEQRGIRNYIVDGGGDLRLAGNQGGRSWSVGVADPRRPQRLLASLSVERGAIVTSGDYMSYFERDGVRYHHVLDPETGYPATGAAASTVIASSATDADALATALMVLGPDAGLALVERLPDVEALIVGLDLKLHRSAGFPPFDGAVSGP